MDINEDCIFCKMAKGEIPVDKIWEDDKHFSFLDLHPINPGHILVIPKKHMDYLFDLNDKEYNELMTKAKELAIMLKQKLKPKRIGMAVEGFGIPHVHIHLVPLNKGNELKTTIHKPYEGDLLEFIGYSN